MNVFFRTIIIGFILITNWTTVCADNNDESTADRSVGAAIGCSLLSNAIVFSFNRFVTRADYAMIDMTSIRRNLSRSWVWDQDEFLVNQIGHPYQGASYYTAGRAHGLGVVGSSLLTLLNSTIWELFLETELPSRNDLIATTIGGVALGEMLHRLAYRIAPSNIPITFLISPQDGFGVAVSPKKFKREELQHVPFKGSILAAIGAITTDFKDPTDLTTQEVARSITANIMADLTYGDIFGASTIEPFSQFEANVQASLARDYNAFKFESDGIIVGKSLFGSASRFATIGASLHYDFIYNNLINFSANSVGLSYKHKRFFTPHYFWTAKLHLNWVLLGANTYPHVRRADIMEGDDSGRKRDYDLGTGEGVNMSVATTTPHWGTFGIGYAGYGIHTIPPSVSDYRLEGYTLIGIGHFLYEHPIGQTISAGIRMNFYHKKGFYKSDVHADEMIYALSLFIKRYFSM